MAWPRGKYCGYSEWTWAWPCSCVTKGCRWIHAHAVCLSCADTPTQAWAWHPRALHCEPINWRPPPKMATPTCSVAGQSQINYPDQSTDITNCGQVSGSRAVRHGGVSWGRRLTDGAWVLGFVAMLSRKLILVPACWAFVAMPALCMGGVLGHPCEVAAACCSHEGRDGGGVGCDLQGSCQHENDCHNDPCQLFVAAKDGGARCSGRDTFAVPPRIDCPLPSALAVMPDIVGRPVRPVCGGSPALPATPRHQSDLPLLV